MPQPHYDTATGYEEEEQAVYDDIPDVQETAEAEEGGREPMYDEAAEGQEVCVYT